MDVTCDRCSTEYEFDDALVSGRGTSVKCTNCGHQFKVRRTDGALPERWVVRTAGGQEIEFRMLRELQAAISRAEVSRDDLLSRGGGHPRRLGAIAELEPFFRGIGGMMSPGSGPGRGPSGPSRARHVTPAGLGGPVPTETEVGGASISPSASPAVNRADMPPVAGPFNRSPSAPPPASDPETIDPATPPVGRLPMMPPTPAPRAVTLESNGEGPGVVAPDDAPPLPAERMRGGGSPEVEQGSRDEVEAAAPVEHGAAPGTPESMPPSSAPVSEVPRRRPVREVRVRAAPLTPTPSDIRFSISDDAYGEPRFTSVVPSRRVGAARWMVGLVVLGLAVLAGVILVPRYLKPGARAPEPASEGRAASLVAEANRELLEGDLEGARDKLLQASALAEGDLKVATDLARLETASADLRWLRLRLLEDGSPDQAMARHELDTAVDRARKSVERAEQVAPQDVGVQRVRVDLLRLQGDVRRARELVGTLAGGGSQPETALALASLDMAEEQPNWPVAVGRLRTAASGDQGLGRARAFLIYALVRAGDSPAARAEYERLVASSRPHPLAPALRAFIERLEPTGKPLDPPVRAVSDAGVGDAAVPGSAPTTGRLQHQSPQVNEGRVPDDYVAPDQNSPAEAADLPGAAPPPAASASPGAAPPTVDTSDLPGFNHE
ncbi:zinc-ribbon domain-containing protein [Chondromyces apiculatus]|uniref:Zinc finger/thioredoxin putative domain-containing protein n=1 Tax=Chondromyces apiculatus DSM 436 TaxID=1192034 RepID=A0A017SWX0_9BACT|nr:zinc-ribbon domain-containing protein [Chondromyces apiculatus]EYF01458.1 Hypothetical protein CAP_8291 [Chondromyces apiculatus DSM 436]